MLCENRLGLAGPRLLGPGEASRSRKESLECPVLVGVSSTLGYSDIARPRGLRGCGSFDREEGVSDEDDRCVKGVRLAYGLGVVRLSGLKLCPVSMPLVDEFQAGRWPKVEFGRRMLFPGPGVEAGEPAILDSLEGISFLAVLP